MNNEPLKSRSMKRSYFSSRQPLTLRSLLIFFLTSTGCFQARAQLLGGFFSQQSRKEELMTAQIAAYQLYLTELRSGIDIARTGLSTAYKLKNGTLDLHTAYFNSLWQANPAIQNNAKAKAIAGLEQQITNEFDQEIAFQKKTNRLTPPEQSYIRQVYQNLVAKCNLDLSELRDVLTPGKLQLTDQQRLERIDGLYAAMQDKLAFTGAFTAKCHQLALGRQQAAKDREVLKKLYGGGQ